MKKVLQTLVLLGMCCVPQFLYGQGKVPFVVSGHKQGSLDLVFKDGTTYVDLQKTARKLGLGVELFAASKQAKITTRGFYAILTAPLKEIVLNAQTLSLKAPVIIQKSAMLAPVEFFLLPQVQQAVGKEISFSQEAFNLERPYDFERVDKRLGPQEDQIVFTFRRKLTWTSSSPNAHTVDVIFPKAVVKRDEFFRLKTGYISSLSIRQERENAQVRLILGKHGTHWTVEEKDGKILIRVGAKPFQTAPALAPKTETKKPVAAVETTPIVAAVASEEVAAPSVTDDDGFEEMPSAEAATPADLPQAAATPAAAPSAAAPAITSVVKTETPTISAAKSSAPVIKPSPVPTVSPAHKKMRIVIDPGHGGKDPGATRSRVREKDLNLAVSKELYKLLKKGKFEVKITRDDDTFLALSERSKIANTFKADLFVSVHTNASKNKNANGFEVYFRSEKATDSEAAETAALENEAMQYEEVHYNFVDALLQSLAKNEYINESSKLAGYMRNAVYKQPGIGIAVSHNNSVRQANFYVLKGVQSPAVLVEMGYISSQKDRGRLTQSKVQKNMAQGIYNGIYNYAKNEGWIK